MQAEPTVFIVDNDLGVLKSMRWLLESEKLRVETFSSGASFLDNYHVSRPGCLILDIRMPGMNGLDVQNCLAERGVKLPIIVLSGHGDVATCSQAFTSGACAFVEKPADDEYLLNRIRQAIDSDLDRHRHEASRSEFAARIAELTSREIEVMNLLICGETPKQIATLMHISFQTVAKHRAKVLTKLKVENDVELARLVLAIDSK